MKAINTSMLLSILTWGLLVIPNARMRAQDVPLTLNIQLTATVQGPDNGGYPVDKVTTITAKLTTANALALVMNARETTYPKGAYLALWNDTVCVVDNSGTNQLDDLSDLFSYDTATIVHSGQVNQATRSVSGTATSLMTLSFDDGLGTSFQLTGLAKTTMSATAVDKNGNQKETVSTTITVVGEGTFLDNDAVASGTISASGKGTVLAK